MTDYGNLSDPEVTRSFVVSYDKSSLIKGGSRSNSKACPNSFIHDASKGPRFVSRLFLKLVMKLRHTPGRLDEETTCTDPTVRAQMQSEAMQSGLVMQHFGALLLELDRTMLTVLDSCIMYIYWAHGQYISIPNLIMIQELVQDGLMLEQTEKSGWLMLNTP
nr:hypothetical protein [Tanacetum cinerariifolium]